MNSTRLLKISFIVLCVGVSSSCEKSTEAVITGLEGQVFANIGPAGHVAMPEFRLCASVGHAAFESM